MKNIIWLPKTKTGKWALRINVFTVLIIILWILATCLPGTDYFLPGSRSEILHPSRVQAIAGHVLLGTFYALLPLALVSFIFSFKALFKEKEKSVLLWVSLIFICISAVYYVYLSFVILPSEGIYTEPGGRELYNL